MRLLVFLFLIVATVVARKKKPFKNPKPSPESILVEPDHLSFFPDNIMPVPFGHIFLEGFEDPMGQVKQPIDLLELHTIYLKDGHKARELIEKKGKKYQIIGRAESFDPSPDFKELDDGLENTDTNDTIMTYWNLEANLQRNIRDPERGHARRFVEHRPDNTPALGKKISFFDKSSFDLVKAVKKSVNFTTCDEFGRNAMFHPSDIVNLAWVPFYIWTNDLNGRIAVSRVHNFTYPTKKLVKKYKDEYGKHLSKTVNWLQPKFLLRDGISEYLLIAADRKGLFDAIPHHELPPSVKKSNLKIPIMSFRLKIVNPFLAMMFCEIQYANIMALSGTEPRTRDEAIAKAARLKMVGDGFPVKRNLEMERHEERSKQLQKSEMEKMKVNEEEQYDEPRVHEKF